MGVTVNERRGEGHQSWKSFWLFSTFTIFPTQRKILVLKNANDAVEGKILEGFLTFSVWGI